MSPFLIASAVIALLGLLVLLDALTFGTGGALLTVGIAYGVAALAEGRVGSRSRT